MAGQIMPLHACALNRYFMFLISVSVPLKTNKNKQNPGQGGEAGGEKGERRAEKPSSHHFLEPEAAGGLCV